MADKLEITKDIVLKMIEHNKIIVSSESDPAITTDKYAKKIGKVFNQIYTDINNAHEGKFQP